jgi:hypothetical protein
MEKKISGRMRVWLHLLQEKLYEHTGQLHEDKGNVIGEKILGKAKLESNSQTMWTRRTEKEPESGNEAEQIPEPELKKTVARICSRNRRLLQAEKH